MMCKECKHFSSDCNESGMWYICVHPKTEDKAVYPDEEPEWCPLLTSDNNVYAVSQSLTATPKLASPASHKQKRCRK